MTKPRQLAEKHRITVPGFAWGKVHHPAGDFDVDRGWYENYRGGFDALAEHGYYPPVLRQHQDDGKGKEARKLEEGFIYGKLVDLFADDDGIKHVLEVPEEVKDLFDKGFISEWSPSFREDWQHPTTGEKLKLAPRHFAFVSVPHQKNLKSSSQFYSLSEEASLTHGLIHEEDMTVEKKKTAKPTDLEDGEETPATTVDFTPLLDVMKGLSDQIQALADSLATDSEEAEAGDSVEDSALEKELAEFRAENKKLRGQQIRQNVKALGIEDDTEVETLVELAESDPAGYATRLTGAVAKVGANRTTRQPEKGGGGGSNNRTPVDKTLGAGEAMELAESELQGEESYKTATPAQRGMMKVRRARELRGEA